MCRMQCRVWSVKCRVRGLKCKEESVECRVSCSIASMMTSGWGRFKGPPSASEWAFGSAGRSNAVQSRSGGQEVGVRAQHENEVWPRFHTGSSVKSVKL